MKVWTLVSGCFVAGLLLLAVGAGSVAQAAQGPPPPPKADVNIQENLASCTVSGDVATGVVWGQPGYNLSVTCDPISSGSLAEVRMALKAPTGVGLFYSQVSQNWFTYGGSSAVTWISTQPQLPIAAQVNAGVVATPGWQSVALPVTVTRSVAQPILTSSLSVQHLDVTVAVNGAFPPGTNGFWIGLAHNGSSVSNITYSSLVFTASPGSPWSQNSDGSFWVNPSALTIGSSYTFSINLPVAVSGPLPVYHKPDLSFNYGISTGTFGTSGTTAGHLSLVFPSGAQTDFTTSGQTLFFYNQYTSMVNVDLPQVAVNVGPATPQNITLVRGKEMVGSEMTMVNFEVDGQCLAGVTVTTPSGAVLGLCPDQSGAAWRYEVDTTDSTQVLDLVSGSYTVTCYSTSGATVTEQVFIPVLADPAVYPVLLGLADTISTTPTLSWVGCTDSNVNMILAQENNDLFASYQLFGNTATSQSLATNQGTGLGLGGYEPQTIFAQGAFGATADGVSYTVARYKQTFGFFNVEPFSVATTFSRSNPWVYQNTAVMTQNRNSIVLTLTPSTSNCGSVVSPRFHGGGKLNGVSPGVNATTWIITGGSAAGGAATAGNVTIDILVRKLNSGLGASATVTVTVRPLGDINGDGKVDINDLILLGQKLNNLYTGSQGPGNFDLTGDGFVTVADRVVLNMVLNGVTVP